MHAASTCHSSSATLEDASKALGLWARKNSSPNPPGLTDWIGAGKGYTAAMLVEESRILQVTIFHTLQKNLGTIDFSVLLLGVMTIADEVDSQLSQAMKSYIAESVQDALPA
jgi:hypothetical protein